MRLICYYGFLEDKKILLSGKLLYGNLRKPKANDSRFRNALSMFKQYFAVGMSYKTVKIDYNDQIKNVKTNKHGTFKTYFNFNKNSETTYTVRYKHETRSAKVFLPEHENLAIISDVDDTFLITYSTSFFKRVWTSATKNFNTRSSVEDIIDIYKNFSGPIFYVSNSQWRLFEVLDGFRKINNMPQGPFLLRGRTKYERIKSIVTSYPYKFILIGDDGQKDPEEYTRIQKEFSKKISAIAIRHVSSQRRFEEVKKILPKTKSLIAKEGDDILNFVKRKINDLLRP